MIIKKILQTLFAVILIIIAFYYYSYKIEPNLLSVTTHSISNDSITKEFEGLKIVQFSDTHLGATFTNKQLEKVVERINNLRPDIVVFTGDLIDHFGSYSSSDKKRTQTILSTLQAPLGKYAIFGNHDHGGGGSRHYQQFMEEADFTVLQNEIETIKSTNGHTINMIGLDDFLLGDPKVKQTLKDLKEDEFNVLLVHEPDVIDRFTTYPIDLQLSGHSHGGQVQFPFKGPIITPPLAKRYTEGMYSLVGLNKPILLYVNRGIGTTKLPLRFFSKPEIAQFTLKSTNK